MTTGQGASPEQESLAERLDKEQGLVDRLVGEIAVYGQHAGETKELAPSVRMVELLNKLRQLEQQGDQRASRLIDLWGQLHGKPCPWDKAVNITAILQKLPEEERLRLLAMNEGAAA